jgi:hypothetical protein
MRDLIQGEMTAFNKELCRWEANKTAIFDPATWFYLYVLCYERVVKPYLVLILQFFLSQQPAS